MLNNIYPNLFYNLADNDIKFDGSGPSITYFLFFFSMINFVSNINICNISILDKYYCR